MPYKIFKITQVLIIPTAMQLEKIQEVMKKVGILNPFF
jgi:hypothetical protein